MENKRQLTNYQHYVPRFTSSNCTTRHTRMGLISRRHDSEGMAIRSSYLLPIPTSKKTTLRWTSALIRKTWEVAWDQWEHRINGILHDKSTRVTIEEIELIELTICQEFLTGRCQLPKADAYLFRGNVERFLRRKVPQLRNWLEQVEAARARQHRRTQTTWPPERILLLCWLRGQTWTLAAHRAKNKHSGNQQHNTHAHGKQLPPRCTSGNSTTDARSY
jgi:hypothetical protein